MPTFNIYITSPAPRLQQSCASFSADFPLEPTRSPVKNPIKLPAGLHVIPGKVHPGPLPDSPGSGNTSLTDPWNTPHPTDHITVPSGHTTGASPADLDSVGTAAAPAQLAAGSVGVAKAFTVTSSVGDGPGGSPRRDRLSNPINGPARPFSSDGPITKPSRSLNPSRGMTRRRELHAERL